MAFLSGAALAAPSFTAVQTDLFVHPEGHAVAWADFNQDGWPDLAVTFRKRPTALFINERGVFRDVAAELGISQEALDTRSLSWGDVNRDGRPDLYIGYGRDTGTRNRLYVNTGDGFEEVAARYGVDLLGTTRQVSWIDYDADGDSDLFVAMRDRASRLLRNDGETFTDVSAEAGLLDPRRTVGAAWWDVDRDGDLDLYLANQSGDTDALYINDNGEFTDEAHSLGVSRLQLPAGRPLAEGSVGATLCDVNRDGFIDLYVPTYGADVLYTSGANNYLHDRTADLGLVRSDQAVSADCGDVNNDGWDDLYLVAYQRGITHGHDGMFINEGGQFNDRLTDKMRAHDGDHGIRFADIDRDGDLDYAITNRASGGTLSVLRNNLPAAAGNALFIDATDADGFHTQQGAEIRVFDPGTNQLIATRVVDTGGGYVSQNLLPTHIGLGSLEAIDVEVTFMSRDGRLDVTVEDVRPRDLAGQALEVRRPPHPGAAVDIRPPPR